MVLDDDYHTVFDNDPTLDRHQRELGEFGFTDCSLPQQALEDYQNGCFYYQPLSDIKKYYDLWGPKTYTPLVAAEPMNDLNLRQVSRNVRAGFDAFFFSTKKFKFSCPKVLTRPLTCKRWSPQFRCWNCSGFRSGGTHRM